MSRALITDEQRSIAQSMISTGQSWQAIEIETGINWESMR